MAEYQPLHPSAERAGIIYVVLAMHRAAPALSIAVAQHIRRACYPAEIVPYDNQWHAISLGSIVPGQIFDESAVSNRVLGVSTGQLSLAPHTGERYLRIQNWISDTLPTPRDLFVYLPEAYLAEPERRFPVLLLHDGQNLFDGNLSYVKGSTWHCGETADWTIGEGSVTPLILAGIGNTGEERMAEYTPTPDTRLGGGKGRLYARVLVEELLPVLRRDLRLRAGPEHTGIAGSSLGGLISLAIALQYPQVFGRVGVLSPSLWWNNRSILDEVRALPARLPLHLWIDMGTAEGEVHLRDTDLLTHLLQRKGWVLDKTSTPPRSLSLPRGSRLRNLASPLERLRVTAPGSPVDMHYERVPNGLHNEAAWAARFGKVLQFLFPA